MCTKAMLVGKIAMAVTTSSPHPLNTAAVCIMQPNTYMRICLITDLTRATKLASVHKTFVAVEVRMRTLDRLVKIEFLAYSSLTSL